MRVVAFILGLVVGIVIGFSIDKPPIDSDDTRDISIKAEYCVELLNDSMCLVKSNSTGAIYHIKNKDIGEAFLKDNL